MMPSATSDFSSSVRSAQPLTSKNSRSTVPAYRSGLRAGRSVCCGGRVLPETGGLLPSERADDRRVSAVRLRPLPASSRRARFRRAGGLTDGWPTHARLRALRNRRGSRAGARDPHAPRRVARRPAHRLNPNSTNCVRDWPGSQGLFSTPFSILRLINPLPARRAWRARAHSRRQARQCRSPCLSMYVLASVHSWP